MLRNVENVTYFCKRFIHTNYVKSAVAETISSSKKDEYYKNANKLHKEVNTKPLDWNDAKPFEDIPGPKPLPIIGNFWRFLPIIGEFYGLDFFDVTRSFYEKHGDISILKGVIASGPVVMLFNVDEMEKLYRNEGVWPIRQGLQSIVRYRTKIRPEIFQGTTDLLSSQGEDWFNVRSKVNPIMMQPRVVKQYINCMDSIASEFIDNVRYLVKSNPDGQMPKTFLNEIYKWAFESAGVIAMDKRFGALDRNLEKDSEVQKLIDNILESFVVMHKLQLTPSFWKFYYTKPWKRFVEIFDFINEVFLKYINEAKEKIKRGDYNDKAEHELSVFQKLLKIDDNIAFTMTLDFLFAGIETTGKTSGSTLYFLAKNPECQRKLRNELMELLPTKDTPITNEILENATYLKAVIKENMRLASIAGGNMRQTVKDMVLCGYQIPKGTNVMNNHMCISTTTDKYFPQAEKFIPERWLRNTTGDLSYKNVHAFANLPFGFGPRSCVGKRFANLEIEILVSKMIRNFELEWPHADMRFATNLVYGIADPLRLKVKEVEM